MSDTLGTYSFLPWLRLGIANKVTAQDKDTATKLRASIPVSVKVTGEPIEGDVKLTSDVTKPVELFGPGDVTGIDPRAIFKVEPRDWITNFEPNYMPYVEFYEEDFPWRFTPAAPDVAKNRLRPWLALIIMTEEEFGEVPAEAGRPCAAIQIKGDPKKIFPPADQLWAWAHVHLNRDLVQQDGVAKSSDMAAVLPRIETVLRDNPDWAYSRLLCPRRLTENTGYHAFVVPSFESGRLSGLGLPAATANPAFFATLSSWQDYADKKLPGVFPIYKRWFFKTGTVGDFEYLVRLLKPRPADARLGRRDMDSQSAAPDLPSAAGPDLKGVLRLGGALKVPDQVLSDDQEAEAKTFEEWDKTYPNRFQQDLAGLINLADDYARQGSPDPVITPPIYGRWHAMTERLLFNLDGSDAPQRGNWVHELNLDPRFRVAAAFGTATVQTNQEDYMDAAWGQAGDIIAANRRIRVALVARETGLIWHSRHILPIDAVSRERTLAITAPVQRRVLADQITVRYRLANSSVPIAATSPPFRRLLRPLDHFSRDLGFSGPNGAEGLIDRINRGEVSAAPPRPTPADLPTVEQVADELVPKDGFSALGDWLRTHPWAKWIVLLLLLLGGLLLLLFASALAAAALALVAIGLFVWFRRLERQATVRNAVLPGGGSREALDALPGFAGFKLEPFTGLAGPELAAGGADSLESRRFKSALGDVHDLFAASAKASPAPERRPIDLGRLTASTLAGIDPSRTVPALTLGSVKIPGKLAAINGERFREVMAYPVIDLPMCKPLIDQKDDHFLPNISKIPPNTITLLETNQRFIEAYMVGVNHEFARELLWREFPTDQRGTCFRQFWDVSEVLPKEGATKDEQRELLRDIPPIHKWSRASVLGDHDNREKGGAKEEELVLVIRGELLKKYPTAVIYAQKAKWQRDKNGRIDTSLPRLFETDDAAGEWLKTALYTAKAEPDITFIGFDLTAKVAQGGTGAAADEEPGWFFVIKERPGEPRFGLDIERDGALAYWNDLAWPDVIMADDDGFLQLKPGQPTFELDPAPPGEPEDKKLQHNEDKQLRWHADTNSAELAYILYQVPVLVAVHAKKMLPD